MQHAGAARAETLAALLPSLPPDTQVIIDPGADEPERSPMRCYRACLDALEPDATHLCVVQDDVTTCRDFPAALEAVVAAQPHDPLALFIPGVGRNQRRMLDACYAGGRWFELDPADWVPTVALVWPRAQVAAFLAYLDRKRLTAARRSDDSVVGEWAREEQVRVLATCPSLVEHPDLVPSLVGTAHWGGANPQRVAACWTGPELSPLDFSW